MDQVVGLDVDRRGWVGIVVQAGRFADAAHFRDFGEAVSAFPSASAIAVDIPIGLPERGQRAADVAARAFVGPRRSSVFLIPPRVAIEQPTYAEALAVCWHRNGRGLSKQSYSLRESIFEVEQYASADSRIVEVHPEVSFRAMAGHPLSYGKRTWGGMVERRRLLGHAGILLPDDLSREVN